ncbi:hypothetical protein CDL15_Pgr025992 [Punica granatum]|uniref:Uncharacterized protein n=1 Tax=Punica granatum TaxID=22663 RepID=A0A218WDI9_PUNGR|nr:hypothetical protein CDL15_Pgr025992 [Punica granatum]
MGNGRTTQKNPTARLPPKRGQIKVKIFNLIVETLVSFCSSSMAALREAAAGLCIPIPEKVAPANSPKTCRA